MHLPWESSRTVWSSALGWAIKSAQNLQVRTRECNDVGNFVVDACFLLMTNCRIKWALLQTTLIFICWKFSAAGHKEFKIFLKSIESKSLTDLKSLEWGEGCIHGLLLLPKWCPHSNVLGLQEPPDFLLLKSQNTMLWAVIGQYFGFRFCKKFWGFVPVFVSEFPYGKRILCCEQLLYLSVTPDLCCFLLGKNISAEEWFTFLKITTSSILNETHFTVVRL